MILPFPVGAASPFRSCERDLLGEPGDSHTVKGSVLRISNFPAWSRNFSSSLDSRLNCSLWVRHFSSSSRTLAYKGAEDEQAGRKIDRRRKMGKWAGNQWRKSSLAEHLSTQTLVYMVRKRQTPSSEGWCPPRQGPHTSHMHSYQNWQYWVKLHTILGRFNYR